MPVQRELRLFADHMIAEQPHVAAAERKFEEGVGAADDLPVRDAELLLICERVFANILSQP